MANQILWDAGVVDEGDVLTTELNSLAAAARTAKGTEYANSTDLRQHFWLEFTGSFGSSPTAGRMLTVFALKALDGTNYEDGDASTTPPATAVVATLPVRATTSAQRITSRRFELPPCKIKFVLQNDADTSLAASSNVLALYSATDEVQ